MARLFLVRHGKIEGEESRYYGHIDIGLSREGVWQAEMLRDRLAKEDIAVVYASDLKRAFRTAEVIAAANALPMISCPELRELDFGQLAGLTFEEVKERYQGTVEFLSGQNPVLSAPGGESLGQLSARIERFIAWLRKEPLERQALIVAHKGSLSVLLCHLLGVSIERAWQFQLAPASLTVVETHPEGTALLRFNDTSHLEGQRVAAGKELIFVLGGARSGKSQFAQKLAAQMSDKVLFVATAAALDDEMRLRIEEHRRHRPQNWRTIEAVCDVGQKVTREIGDAQVVVLDCLTLLVSNIIGECLAGGDVEQVDFALAEQRVNMEIQGIINCFDNLDASFIAVSNEVGMGLVPANRVGRLYRDLLGKVNQALAKRADRVYFMFGGLPVNLKKQSEVQ